MEISDITINEQQRLFVINTGHGYSAAGFDYVFKQAKQLQEKLLQVAKTTNEYDAVDEITLQEEMIGSMAQYMQYKKLLALATGKDLGTWYDADTPNKVKAVLNRCMKSGNEIRIFYGDQTTGRDWMEQYDMVGTVGRSTGLMKIPLLVGKGESGAPGMLDNCIVRIIDVESHDEMYRHPKYHLPDLEVHKLSEGEAFDLGYTYGVYANGAVQANFKSLGAASHWLAFMAGNCMEQPQ